MTIGQILQNACISKYLAPLDLELLLSSVLRKRREFLFAHPEKKITASQAAKFNRFVKRRVKGEPIAYLSGKKEFYSLEFCVNKNVLIPRPETELLVEKAIEKISFLDPRLRGDDKLVLIDIGTGSGNVIISLLKNIPAKKRQKMNFFALDISKKALQTAKRNAKKHNVNNRIKFLKSDLLKYFLKKKAKFQNIVIIANLPYVSHELYSKNQKNLRFEPKNALISRNNGLAHYTELLKQIKALANSGSILHATCYMEISPEQKNALLKIIKQALPRVKIELFRDLSGRTRVIEFVYSY